MHKYVAYMCVHIYIYIYCVVQIMVVRETKDAAYSIRLFESEAPLLELCVV